MAASEAGTVEARGVTVRFPGVVANDDVSLVFRAGEVHCLLGENGAGKTTLVDVLTGMRHPDSGGISVDGRPVTLTGPRDALDLGIGRVFQEPLLVPGFTVLENLLLGRARRGASGSRWLAPDGETGREVAEALATFDLTIDARVEAGRLSLGQRQQVEFVRAVRDATRLLILDEPTATLAPPEVERLEEMVRGLAARGRAVVFITHKLREALAVGTRVTVLRRGRVVGSLGPGALTAATAAELEATLLTMMFGPDEAGLSAGTGRRTRAALPPPSAAEMTPFPRPDTMATPAGAAPGPAFAVSPARPVLQLVGVSVSPQRGEAGLHAVSLTVAAGEVVGVAGVDGNGQRELAEAVAGRRPTSGGDILLGGENLAGFDVAARRARGLGYVSDDRVGEGSVGELSVAVNAVLDRIGRPPLWRRGVAVRAEIVDFAQRLVDSLDVDLVSVEQPCRTLSGGNLQKLVLARELASRPVALVFSEPTRGLDARTTRTVRRRILDQAAKMAAVLVISTDLDELLELCDRIAVLRGGRLVGMVPNQPEADVQVGRLMSGDTPTAAPA